MPRKKITTDTPVDMPNSSTAPQPSDSVVSGNTPIETTAPQHVAPLEQEKGEVEALKEQVAELTKMLRATADVGRLLNYDSQKNLGKQPMKVKLSEYNGGIIVGWRTIKDIAVFHPTTGKQVGEEYQIEVLIQDDAGSVTKQLFNSIPAFTDARYTKRIEATVTSKKEDANGNITFELALPDGRQLALDSRFIN